MRQETWKLMHGPMGTVVRTRASCSLFSANLLLSDEKVKHFSWKWAICRVLSVGSHRLTSLRSSDRNKRIWLRRQHRFLCLAERNERENVDNLAATCSARVKRPADQKQEKMNFFHAKANDALSEAKNSQSNGRFQADDTRFSILSSASHLSALMSQLSLSWWCWHS